MDEREDSGHPASSELELETLAGTVDDQADLLDEQRGLDPVQIGRFVVLRRIGSGGMGVVYAAYDNQLDRKLAIKLVRPERARGDARARVMREAQAMARLSHPNVVQIYEVGEHAGQVFVAMEFVTGETMRAWVERERERAPATAGEGELWRRLLAKYVDAGRGLAAAHAAGIVHRDFKPDNAIVGEDGRVRVLDFGIARAAGSTPAQLSEAEGPGAHGRPEPSADPPRPARAGAPTGEPSSGSLSNPLTATGAMLGTPAYMSPEQFRGRSLDARSDQFSFCVALYEALYDQRPFPGSNATALMMAVVNGKLREPPPGARVPSWLREILLRGLASEADARWPSIDALLEALEDDPERRRRTRARAALAVGAATLTLVAAAWFAEGQWQRARKADAERHQARLEEARAQRAEAEAQAERDRALERATASARRARDTARVLAAEGTRDDPTLAAALLRDVEQPAETRGWRSAALNVLGDPISQSVIAAHEDRIVDLEFSPDGRWLVSASFDGEARLWPVDARGRLRAPARDLPHDDAVYTANFSPDGRHLVTACRDHRARIWAVPTAAEGGALEPTHVLEGHGDIVWSADFSPDGERVVTGSRDGTVGVWSVATGERERELRATQDIVWWAAFTPDGRGVVSTDGVGAVLLWPLQGDQGDAGDPQPRLLAQHGDGVHHACFDPAGERIASAAADGTVTVSWLDGSREPLTLSDHEGEIYRVAFAPDGRSLAAAARAGSATLWRFDDEGKLAEDPRDAIVHDGNVWTVDFSADGRLLASGGNDARVRLGPLRGPSPAELAGHSAGIFVLDFHPKGELLATSSNDGELRLWSTDSALLDLRLPLAAAPRGLVVDPDERLAIAGDDDGGLSLWRLPEPGRPSLSLRELGGARVHEGMVRALALGPGGWLASGDNGGRSIALWALADFEAAENREGGGRVEPRHRLEAPSVQTRALALDPGGEWLAAASAGGEVTVWKLEEIAAGRLDGEVIGRHDGTPHRLGANVLRFTPDGERLISTGQDGRVMLWARGDEGWAALRTFEVHSNRVWALAVSPDGRRFASGSVDRSVRVWELDDLDAPPLVLEHGGSILDLSFDAAGERLLSASTDANAYLWTLAAPEQPRLFTGAGGELRSARLVFAERYVVGAGLDGKLRLWPMEDGASEPIIFDTGERLDLLATLDDGATLVSGGAEPSLRLWRLPDQLDVESLHGQLEAATAACLSAEQRMHYVGEAEAVATSRARACERSR